LQCKALEEAESGFLIIEQPFIRVADCGIFVKQFQGSALVSKNELLWAREKLELEVVYRDARHRTTYYKEAQRAHLVNGR
jgi:hypothetical protein